MVDIPPTAPAGAEAIAAPAAAAALAPAPALALALANGPTAPDIIRQSLQQHKAGQGKWESNGCVMSAFSYSKSWYHHTAKMSMCSCG